VTRPRGEVVLLALALGWPTLVAWLYFVVLAQPDPAFAGAANPAAQTVYTLSKFVQFGVPALWLWWTAAPGSMAGWFRPRGWLVGLILGLAIVLLMLTLYIGLLAGTPVLAEAAERLRGKVTELGCATPGRFLLLAVFLSGLHSWLEEFYYRGFLYGSLRHYCTVPVAVVVSSLGFMAHHVIILWMYFPQQVLLAVVPLSASIAVGGALWAWLYERTGSLIGSWISHALADVGLMLIGYWLIFG
jgi:membrane protease YdiL (CAAX protease family)